MKMLATGHALNPPRDVPSRARANPPHAAKRTAVIALALLGAGIAARLTMYQLGATDAPWEPLFGEGTTRVLRSSFSRSLPFPDAAVGLLAYLAELALVVAGGFARWRAVPLRVYAYGAIALGFAAGSAVLVGVQAAWIHAFCTLCLVSAALSFVLAVPAATELAATLKARRSR
jgi:uncharacterized membrane protein